MVSWDWVSGLFLVAAAGLAAAGLTGDDPGLDSGDECWVSLAFLAKVGPWMNLPIVWDPSPRLPPLAFKMPDRLQASTANLQKKLHVSTGLVSFPLETEGIWQLTPVGLAPHGAPT